MEERVITERSGQNWLIFIVAVSVVMIALDYSMLNISLPTIAEYFNIKIGFVTWIPLAYLLVITSSLLGFGKLGDIKGYKKVFITGVGFFVIGTFLCAIAPNIQMIIAFRMVQSLGEAMLSPVGIALITSLLPQGVRGKALGVAATSQGLGLCMGPLIGGLINANFGWRAIFLTNIPIGIILIAIALKMLPKERLKSTVSKFDFIGTAFIFTSLSFFVFALNSVSRLGLKNPAVAASFFVAIIAFILFIRRQSIIEYPILDLKLFKNRDFNFANMCVFLTICCYMGLYFLLPFYLEMVRGFDVARSGMIIMVTPVMLMVLSVFSGRLSDRIGSRYLSSIGIGCGILGFAMASFFNNTTPLYFIIPVLILMGTAMGLFLAPNNKLVMAHAPSDRQGVASGVYKTVLNIGSVCGIAVFPIILMKSIYIDVSHNNMSMAQARHSPEVMAFGFRAAFIFGIFVLVLALAASMLAKDKTEEAETLGR